MEEKVRTLPTIQNRACVRPLSDLAKEIYCFFCFFSLAQKSTDLSGKHHWGRTGLKKRQTVGDEGCALNLLLDSQNFIQWLSTSHTRNNSSNASSLEGSADRDIGLMWLNVPFRQNKTCLGGFNIPNTMGNNNSR